MTALNPVSAPMIRRTGIAPCLRVLRRKLISFWVKARLTTGFVCLIWPVRLLSVVVDEIGPRSFPFPRVAIAKDSSSKPKPLLNYHMDVMLPTRCPYRYARNWKAMILPFPHNRRYASLTRLPSCRCYRLVFVTGLPDLRLILRAIMNRPNSASPNEIRITSSVAKLSPVRLELGAGPADDAVNLTIAWPKELFSRFVSPCTGRASAESSYVDAGYPAISS